MALIMFKSKNLTARVLQRQILTPPPGAAVSSVLPLPLSMLYFLFVLLSVREFEVVGVVVEVFFFGEERG